MKFRKKKKSKMKQMPKRGTSSKAKAKAERKIKKEEETPRVEREDVQGMAARIVVETYTDMQNLRTSAMNRLRAIAITVNENLVPGQVQSKKEQESYEKKYSDAKLPDIIKRLIKEEKFTGEEKAMVNHAMKMAMTAGKLERANKTGMKEAVELSPVWDLFLEHVRGIGPTIAAQLLAKIPGEKYSNVAKLWAHTGNHLVCPICTEQVFIMGSMKTVAVVARQDGKCQECGAQGVAEKRKKGKSLRSNRDLKTLVWKVGSCLMKTSSPVYKEFYDHHKEKQLNREYAPGVLAKIYNPQYSEGKNPYKQDTINISLLHAHNRAMRKMTKLFLQHYWVVCRLVANEPVRVPWVQEHTSHTTIITWRDILKANEQEPPKELTDREDQYYKQTG